MLGVTFFGAGRCDHSNNIVVTESGNYRVLLSYLGVGIAVRKAFIAVLAVVVCDIAVLCAGRIFRLNILQIVSKLWNDRVRLGYPVLAVFVGVVFLTCLAVIISNIAVLGAGRSLSSRGFNVVTLFWNDRISLGYFSLCAAVRVVFLAGLAVIVSDVSVRRAGRSFCLDLFRLCPSLGIIVSAFSISVLA